MSADPAGKTTTTVLDAPATAAPGATAAPLRARRPMVTRPRSWRDIFDRRRLARRFSRENVLSFGRTMLWVVPLTLLIWVYAERSQVLDSDPTIVQVRMTTGLTDRVVSSRDNRVMLTLRGPRAQMREVLRRFSEQPLPLQIDRYVDPDASGPQTVSAAAMLASHPMLADAGVTAKQVTPEWLEVTVDRVIEREVPVVMPDDIETIASATFTPAEVVVRGPRRVIEQAPENDLRAIATIAPQDDRLGTPGTKEFADVAIELPESLESNNVRLKETTSVHATVVVQNREERYQYPSMPILVSGPKGLFDEFTVQYDASLPHVELIGPKDQIDMLRVQVEQATDGPRPYALLVVWREDAGTRQRKRLIFEQLPQGVRVSDNDKLREVTFDLIPRTNPEDGL